MLPVPGEFVPFDQDQIDAEFEALERASASDAAKLEFCMELIEDTPAHENPKPALVRTFDEGFKELRHEKGIYKGRLLYYDPPMTAGEAQELVVLVVFRKQTQKTPNAIVNKAVSRMRLDLAKRKETKKK